MSTVAKTPGGLLTRVVVGALLAAVAIAAVWAGGIAFTALVATACLLMSAEWSVMHGVPRGFRLASLVVLAFVAGVTVYVSAADALIVLAASAGAIGLFMRGFDRKRAFWVAAGLLYCGLPMVALLWLRAVTGVATYVVWIFVVVWSADIGAYLVGRAVGGAKFAPSISPNKTWAGVFGGVLIAAIASVLDAQVVRFLMLPVPLLADLLYIGAVLGAAMAAVAIAGDLFESWLKRRAGVKDSGNLLPGHGGVMDRIDGLVPVAVLSALLAYASGIGR